MVINGHLGGVVQGDSNPDVLSFIYSCARLRVTRGLKSPERTDLCASDCSIVLYHSREEYTESAFPEYSKISWHMVRQEICVKAFRKRGYVARASRSLGIQ
jgi:hypothetical protein